jgi:hypothetical protein
VHVRARAFAFAHVHRCSGCFRAWVVARSLLNHGKARTAEKCARPDGLKNRAGMNPALHGYRGQAALLFADMESPPPVSHWDAARAEDQKDCLKPK